MGELPGQVLALTDLDSVDLHDHVHETPTVAYDTPDTDVIDVFRANPESSVAVLDDGSILGVIYAEDLLHIVAEEAGETLYEFTGVREEVSVARSLSQSSMVLCISSWRVSESAIRERLRFRAPRTRRGPIKFCANVLTNK